MTDAVRWVQDKLWVDRLEATIEAHTMAAAQVREDCTIPGTSVRTAWLCRDKPSMKEALREAGVPTAASAAVDSAAEVHAFADAVGFPLILKPRTGAGALDTIRVDDARRARRRRSAAFGGQGVESIAVEEFVEGHEGFYDTIAVDGHVALDFVSHYYPNVLEAMRTRWISPQFVSTNRIDSAPDYAGAARDGRAGSSRRSASAPRPRTWSGSSGRRACGSPRSAAARRASARGTSTPRATTSTSTASGRTRSCTATSRPRPSRRYASGIVALRPDRDGQITGYSGVDETPAALGEWVIDAHLPPPGTPTQPVEAGYMANAYVRMRHPDYDTLRGMLDDVGRTRARPRRVTCRP